MDGVSFLDLIQTFINFLLFPIFLNQSWMIDFKTNDLIRTLQIYYQVWYEFNLSGSEYHQSTPGNTFNLDEKNFR